MGVFEEAKILITSLQCRVQRVYDAGLKVEQDPTNKSAKTKFKIMYATLENLARDFEIHMSSIIRHKCKGTPTSDVVDDEKLRAAFEEKYIGCKIIADEYLPEAVADTTLNKTFFENKSHVGSSTYNPVEKLAVPKFKGDQKEYTSFRNQFDVLVHNNQSLQPVIKFSYLKAYLEGEPLKIINNLLLNDENYHLALGILDSRYSNRRAIAQDHFDQLWTAPKAMLGEVKSIRRLLNIIIESVGALKTQKYAVDQWDPILLYLFQKKLTAPLRGQWELVVDTNDDPTVDEFVTFLTKFCKAAGAGQGTEKVHDETYNQARKITTLHTAQPTHQVPKRAYGKTNDRKEAFSC